MNENAIAKARYEALEEAKKATARSDLFEARDGLRSLLAGAWGRENIDALGGGKAQIEKAFAVLTRECENDLDAVRDLLSPTDHFVRFCKCGLSLGSALAASALGTCPNCGATTTPVEDVTECVVLPKDSDGYVS